MTELLTLHTTSALEKIFPNTENIPEFSSFSVLKGEKFSFQIVLKYTGEMFTELKINTETDLPYNLYVVRDVPVELAAHLNRSDDRYISKNPGLYPDLLEPVTDKTKLRLLPNQNRVLWVEFDIPENANKGSHTINITAETADAKAETVFMLDVINAKLPEQKLLYTQWFHCDCLSSYYHVEPMSEAHWSLIENYMENYAAYGGNMILTPIFTPALDTEIGAERPTFQLIDIHREETGYSFKFDKLERFMALAESKGITHFELAHLFTQWGAECTPKIIDDEGNKLAGWFLKADSEEYKALIIPLVAELKKYLKNTGRFDNCFFHISDEPCDDNIESYRKAAAVVKDVLADCKVMDALSETKFWEEGLVKIPVAANNAVDNFIEKGTDPLWTYYCCAQGRDGVSNRFIAMPSVRNRLIGLQLYKYALQGFLHWGYNFYYSEHSVRMINPFLTTDTDSSFPAGDPFSVYPGADGRPMPSIRQLVFFDGLQDLRALELLETISGKSHEELVCELENRIGESISFKNFPQEKDNVFSSEWMLNIRKTINEMIAEYR
ncbi:MAG: DUF4091 domain-containing protein [Clostridia bacterium]|nr:DUF4091 domain-containing protein [Clostridia bacterium]